MPPVFMKAFADYRVGEGELAIAWIGQAGFLFKDSAGFTLAVDPYLTNSVERIWGFKRLMAPVAAPEEFTPDILAVTHFHEDHLDIDAMPAVLANRVGGHPLFEWPSSHTTVRTVPYTAVQWVGIGIRVLISKPILL